MFNGLVSMAKWVNGPITPRAHLLIGPFGHRNKSIKHRTTAIGQLTFGGWSQVCPAVRSETAPRARTSKIPIHSQLLRGYWNRDCFSYTAVVVAFFSVVTVVRVLPSSEMTTLAVAAAAPSTLITTW